MDLGVRQVTLAGTDVTTSALGYGCSSLMATLNRAESVCLLESAFDSGITHFDVARAYGYGEAESALGEMLRKRRDQVTVATKAGIAAPRRSRRMAVAKAAARRVVGVARPLRSLARRQAQRLVTTGQFGVAEVRASLETSLRELGTEYVDLLLLHECRPEDLSDELLAYLGVCVDEGKLRQFGIATEPLATREVLEARPATGAVVQVANSIVSPVLVSLPPAVRGKALITHSALEGVLDRVHGHVVASEERRRHWSATVGDDCGERALLARLMLGWAALSNPEGIVLFSARDPRRIRANASLETGAQLRDQVAKLELLVRRELRSAVGDLEH